MIVLNVSNIFANVSPLEIEESNSYKVSSYVIEIKHHDHESLGCLRLMYESWESVKSFQMQYQITAAEIPERVLGIINIETLIEEIHD